MTRDAPLSPPGDPSLITGLVAFLYCTYSISFLFPLRHMQHDWLALRRHLAAGEVPVSRHRLLIRSYRGRERGASCTGASRRHRMVKKCTRTDARRNEVRNDKHHHPASRRRNRRIVGDEETKQPRRSSRKRPRTGKVQR